MQNNVVSEDNMLLFIQTKQEVETKEEFSLGFFWKIMVAIAFVLLMVVSMFSYKMFQASRDLNSLTKKLETCEQTTPYKGGLADSILHPNDWEFDLKRCEHE